MRRISPNELKEALAAVGVARGSWIHIQSDLRRIGPVEGESSREGMLNFYLQNILEMIGSEGTLTVLTASMSCGYDQKPFFRESTPSEVGVFSEHIRCQPGAIRSCHPIISITGIGALAREICDQPHFNAYGYNSPWKAMEERNAIICTLGLGLEDGQGGTTFFHYLENRYGVPYQYCKQLDIPVISGGKPVTGTFTMTVRYLDFGISYYTHPFKRRLHQEGIACVIPLGSSTVWAARTQGILKRGAELLDEDRFMLLKITPQFRPGEIPTDGATRAR